MKINYLLISYYQFEIGKNIIWQTILYSIIRCISQLIIFIRLSQSHYQTFNYRLRRFWNLIKYQNELNKLYFILVSIISYTYKHALYVCNFKVRIIVGPYIISFITLCELATRATRKLYFEYKFNYLTTI